MGVVWVAHSTALDVDVALKMLRPELAGTQAVDRMAREARAAAQLGHPAMVRVLDFGTSEQGEPFLAMELLSGEELNTRLEREQRLPAQAAIGLLLPIIDGLGIAHEKGIVHRDIKPENIFIASDEQRRVQPKVLDFGIAKLGQEHTVSRLTQIGAVMGSPYYLSPEQAEGLEDIDFRCDIWSIGVVLYEAITGSLPFAASNYNALMRSILRDDPTPITDLATGDAQLWMIIDRCLKKDREQRWGSMWELGEALALWLFERGVRVDAAGRSLRHAWLDSALTGVQILVPSETPATETPTLPPVIISEEVLRAPRQPLPSTLVRTEVRPRRQPRARAWPWLVVAGGLLGSAAAWWLLRGSAAPAAAAVPSEPQVAAAAAVSSGVIATAVIVPTGQTSASPVPAPPSTPSVAPLGTSARPNAAPVAPPKPAKLKAQVSPPEGARRTSAASRQASEFGF